MKSASQEPVDKLSQGLWLARPHSTASPQRFYKLLQTVLSRRHSTNLPTGEFQ